MKVGYALLLLATLFTVISHRDLVPRTQDFFWSPAQSLSLLVNTAILWAVLALHEFSHVLAARSLEPPARISLGTRLFDLVLQTNVTGLWAIPRHQRYRVYLAGMACDVLIACVAFLTLAYVPLPLAVQQILPVVVLGVLFGILWQLQFFMRTDIYFVAMDLLRCGNLFEDALSNLRFQIRRVWLRLMRSQREVPEANPLAHLPKHERRAAVLYGPFAMVGSIIAISLFAAYGVPILGHLLMEGGSSLWSGITTWQPWLVIDGAVTLVVLVAFQALFVVTFIQTHPAISRLLRLRF